MLRGMLSFASDVKERAWRDVVCTDYFGAYSEANNLSLYGS